MFVECECFYVIPGALKGCQTPLSTWPSSVKTQGDFGAFFRKQKGILWDRKYGICLFTLLYISGVCSYFISSPVIILCVYLFYYTYEGFVDILQGSFQK